MEPVRWSAWSIFPQSINPAKEEPSSLVVSWKVQLWWFCWVVYCWCFFLWWCDQAEFNGTLYLRPRLQLLYFSEDFIKKGMKVLSSLEPDIILVEVFYTSCFYLYMLPTKPDRIYLFCAQGSVIPTNRTARWIHCVHKPYINYKQKRQNCDGPHKSEHKSKNERKRQNNYLFCHKICIHQVSRVHKTFEF